jgi:GntR family transcriptional regulator
MNAETIPGRTKRTAARLALTSAIRSGLLAPGDVLPPETELAEIIGVSLGTIQVALRQLQDIGVITRRRGDGTRVASNEPLTPSVWHFRLIRLRDGQPVHPIREKIRIGTTADAGVWSNFLGNGPELIRIVRRFGTHGSPSFGAEMYIAPKLVPKLVQVGPDELKMVNIRTYLETRYGLSVTSTRQTVRLTRLEAKTARRCGLSTLVDMLEIHAEAFSATRQPVYFQRIFVPASDYGMELSEPADVSTPGA